MKKISLLILILFTCLQLLRVQNRRLAERLCQRNRIEIDLRSRIDQLEKKQLNDDTKLYVINRYWNQLNEDMRLILQRLDGDQEQSANSGNSSGSNSNSFSNNRNNNNTNNVADNLNEDSIEGMMNSSENVSEETTSFMRQLANCDKEELDESLQQRVLLSTRAVSKVRFLFVLF